MIYIHKSLDIDKTLKKKELANTNAIKGGNIIKIDNIYFERPSLRILELLEALSLENETEDSAGENVSQ